MSFDMLGLSGKAGAGKDFVCDRLIIALKGKKKVSRVAFADELRYELETILTDGAAHAYLPALWEKPYPEPIRWLLQHYGTEYRRAQDPDYWVKKAISTAQRHIFNGSDLVIFTDVRFGNEAGAIRYQDGLVVEVVADDATRAHRLGGVVLDGHASEDIDFEPDYRISNIERPVLPAMLAFRLGLGDGTAPVTL